MLWVIDKQAYFFMFPYIDTYACKIGEYSVDNDQKDEQSLISRIMSNNRTLYDLGALDVLFTQLEVIITNKAR